MKLSKILKIVVILMLLVGAIGVNEYGYYQLLRVFVCAYSAYWAIQSHKHKNEGWMWKYGIIAFIFNPIIPLHLGRELWTVVDIIGAVVLAFAPICFSSHTKNA